MIKATTIEHHQWLANSPTITLTLDELKATLLERQKKYILRRKGLDGRVAMVKATMIEHHQQLANTLNNTDIGGIKGKPT